MSPTSFVKYASVVLELAICKKLDYGILPEQMDKIKVGMKVQVPVRGFLRTGYVFSIKDQPDFNPVKAIAKLDSDVELINQDLFELALWMANYYCAPLQSVFKTILPSSIRKDTKHKEQLFVMRGKTKEELAEICKELRNKSAAQADVLDVMLNVKKGILLSQLLEETKGSRSPVESLAKKGLLVVDIVRVDRSPLIKEEYFKTKSKQLNPDQKTALEKINDSIEKNRFETHLLHGVTGSGKTEVYLQAIEKALSLDKGTIMLVPEISLTAQTIERFKSRFDERIAILHHRLSHGERFDEWHKIRDGSAKIVIGARSAIFSPVKNLGLIIVDEEHEASYKQSEEAPAYHAREVAVMRGKMGNGTVILGSATPSIESYYNAQNGKYTLSVLHSRADAATMPTVTIVDMKKEYDKAKGITTFSDLLLTKIQKKAENGEQSILFLNRRGYHTSLLCKECGKAVECRHCDVGLTFHKGNNHLSCHLCGFEITPPPNQCPNCKSPNPMKFRGVGTEQVQKALHAIFPNIRTIRIDADTTKHKGSHQKLLRDFGAGKADVLIGTQMIAKGLHFPQVTMVGVLNSDASLNIPDFRASETVFQLITQVSGRSGRGALAGEVIVQTCMPENSTIQLACRQDFEAFYNEEVEMRKIFEYPPYTQLTKLVFSGADLKKTQAFADQLRGMLIERLPKNFTINPVIPAGHAKVKDKYKLQFLVKGKNIYTFNKELEKILESVKIPSTIRLFTDINPTSTYF